MASESTWWHVSAERGCEVCMMAQLSVCVCVCVRLKMVDNGVSVFGKSRQEVTAWSVCVRCQRVRAGSYLSHTPLSVLMEGRHFRPRSHTKGGPSAGHLHTYITDTHSRTHSGCNDRQLLLLWRHRDSDTRTLNLD